MISNYFAAFCCLYIIYLLEPITVMISLDKFCIRHWLVKVVIVLSVLGGCLFTIAYCLQGNVIDWPTLFILSGMSLTLAVYRDQIFLGVCGYGNRSRS